MFDTETQSSVCIPPGHCKGDEVQALYRMKVTETIIVFEVLIVQPG